MAKLNVPTKTTHITHEGAPADRISPEAQLRRSVMACLLWEDSFYESGVDIADRISALAKLVEPRVVAGIAIEAREKWKLRHVPLHIVREMARLPKHKEFVADTLSKIIQRADELAEFVAIYWKDGRQPLSAQVKRGLSSAFQKFNAYSLAKYNRDSTVKLRDVLFLCHAKPIDKDQEALWKQLVDGTLPIPGTWENRLSSGEDKKTVWEDLLAKKELGALALLRNLRNMNQIGVDEELIFSALDEMKIDRVLPFRFISASRWAPQWESKLEAAMLRAIEGRDKLPGKTVLLVDVSGSMFSTISAKSDLQRTDAANGLAILARELCEEVAVYAFGTVTKRVPDRRGFALRDAISSTDCGGSTNLGDAVLFANGEKCDRIIVITDEQSAQSVPNPVSEGYMINVAAYRNGVGYGAWTHIDGWSEAVFDYIIELEEEPLN